MGISPDALPFIWERFYIEDQARTRSTTPGSGLGLSIVKLMVEGLGGGVSVESTPGQGSRFSVTLPATGA